MLATLAQEVPAEALLPLAESHQHRPPRSGWVGLLIMADLQAALQPGYKFYDGEVEEILCHTMMLSWGQA